jgi:hypothetical protein
VSNLFLIKSLFAGALMQISETKRKRHDMTPVSKSLASSGLLRAIERIQGMFTEPLSIKFVLDVYMYPGPSRSSRTTLPDCLDSSTEQESDSETEIEPLSKRAKNSMHKISASEYCSGLND